MADPESVRRIGLSLPGAEDRSDEQSLRLYAAGRQFAWTWQERVHPGKPRVPNPGALVVLCDPVLKQVLLEAEPDLFFIDEHLKGYPAVVVWLDRLDEARMAELLAAARSRCAPKL